MATAPEAAISTALGSAIRAAREASGLSMRAAAREAGVSQPFLSQVEHGTATPSLVSLYRIANALGLSPNELIPTTRAPQEIQLLRADEGERVPVTEAANSASSRLLTGGPGHRLVVMEYLVEPGEDLGGWFSSDGEMTVYVAAGTVEVVLEDEGAWTLRTGDSLTHPGRIRNTWRAAGDEQARIVLAYAPAGPTLTG